MREGGGEGVGGGGRGRAEHAEGQGQDQARRGGGVRPGRRGGDVRPVVDNNTIYRAVRRRARAGHAAATPSVRKELHRLGLSGHDSVRRGVMCLLHGTLLVLMHVHLHQFCQLLVNNYFF